MKHTPCSFTFSVFVIKQTYLILPESLQSAAGLWTYLPKSLSNLHCSPPPMTFKFACIFHRYNLECYSKSIVKCELRHSQLISCKTIPTSNCTCMFIQCKQTECFKDKKKTANGRNVVVQVDASENYIDQCLGARECSVEQFASHSVHCVCI